jgi:hypothetical protein
MRAALRAVVALAIVMATTALAGEEDEHAAGRRASPATKPSWEFAITAYPTVVRGGENYTSAIAVADRGPLHLEARYNYESVGARSAFVGWTFSGGEAITWELTPPRRRLGYDAGFRAGPGSYYHVEEDRLLCRSRIRE